MEHRAAPPTAAPAPAPDPAAAPAATPAVEAPAPDPANALVDLFAQLSHRFGGSAAASQQAPPAEEANAESAASAESVDVTDGAEGQKSADETKEAGIAEGTEDTEDDADWSTEEEECAICFETKFTKGFPAGCGHRFCGSCTDICLRRSLRCPMCRAEAPESAKPGPSRSELLVTAALMFRIQELERLRAEAEERRSAAAPPPPRPPRTRLGRWVQARVNTANLWLDALLD